MAGGPDVLNTALQQLVNNKLQMELLWENASPTSDFAAQTISLDLSGYDSVKIIYAYYCGSPNNTNMTEINVGLQGNFMDVINVAANTYMRGESRSAEVTTTAIVFNDNYEKYFNNTTGFTTMNDFQIPIAIYGIKCIN